MPRRSRDTLFMQSEQLTERRTAAERDVTVLLRAPLRDVYAEEAIPHGELQPGMWGKDVLSTSAATRGLKLRSVDPGGTDR
jgi:hypothetical protein